MREITFKSWLKSQPLQFFGEMGGIRDASADHIKFTTHKEYPDFDEKAVEKACRESAKTEFDEKENKSVVHDKPSDDEDFDTEHPREWLKDNPEPDEDDYEDGDEDEEYVTDRKIWERQYNSVSNEFEYESSRWHRDQEKLAKRTASDVESEREEWIERCVEEKEEDHEKNNPHEEHKDNFSGLRYSFAHRGEEYSVEFVEIKFGPDLAAQMTTLQVDFASAKKELEGFSWTVLLEGPHEYDSTGNKGGGATAVYTQLLLAVKKLITDHDARMLTFSPWEPGMGLVYTRFAKSYLTNWTLVLPHTYLRNDIKPMLIGGEDMNNRILANQKDHDNSMAEIHRNKQIKRTWERTKEDWLGKVVAYKRDGHDLSDDNYGIAMGIDKRNIMMVKTGARGWWQTLNVPLDYIVQGNLVQLKKAQEIEDNATTVPTLTPRRRPPLELARIST